MIVDIFKDRQVFDTLEKHNSTIREVCRKVRFARPGQEYDIPNNLVSYWFDPDYLRQLPIVKNYPRKSPEITFDPKWNLLLFFANYLPLYLTHLFYGSDRKYITIEDMAGGMGALVFYLSELGFINFHITEQFTQVSPFLLDSLMKAGEISYQLNKEDFAPTVINLSEWTHITRTFIPDSCELICLYNNPGIWYIDHGMLYIRSYNSHIAVPDFVKLCSDNDGTSDAFCHVRKYDEFSALLRSRKVIV